MITFIVACRINEDGIRIGYHHSSMKPNLECDKTGGLNPRFDIKDYMPYVDEQGHPFGNDFDWGAPTRGSLQLSLGLCDMVGLSDEDALRVHLKISKELVIKLPKVGFALDIEATKQYILSLLNKERKDLETHGK